MKSLLRVASLALLLIVVASAREIRWAGLESVVKNKRVEVTLPDGSKAIGRANRVDPDALYLTEASGERKIPRAGVKEINVIRNGKLYRSLFLTWGALTALGGALESGGKGIAAGVAIGAGGFVLGDYLDRRKTLLTIIE